MADYTVVGLVDGDYMVADHIAHVTAADPYKAADAAKEKAIVEMDGMIPERGGSVIRSHEVENGYQAVAVFEGHLESLY